MVGGATGGTIKKSSNANSETNNVPPLVSGTPITVTSTTLSQHLGGHVSNSDLLTIPIATMATTSPIGGTTGVTGGGLSPNDGFTISGMGFGPVGISLGGISPAMQTNIPAGEHGPARLESPNFGLASDGSGL